MFVFDYRSFKDTWDWRQIEFTILAQLRNHSEHWQKDLSVTSKFVLLILLPANIDGVNPAEHRKSFKNALQLSEDRSLKELSDYFLQSGLNPLKTTMSKSFAKKIYDLVVMYYREKKENIKRK